MKCSKCHKEKAEYCFCRECFSEIASMLEFCEQQQKNRTIIKHQVQPLPETKRTVQHCKSLIPKNIKYPKNTMLACIEEVDIHKHQVLVCLQDKRVSFFYHVNIEAELIKAKDRYVPCWLKLDKHKIVTAII